MTLSYLPVHFFIEFESPAKVDNPPLFVLRSVLGKELHSMSCLAHNSVCADCMYNHTCAYSFLFETILSQQNEVVPGRDRASHPFAFTQGANVNEGRHPVNSESGLQKYDFTITFFGKAIEYLPYVYAAFVRAGKNGLFKARTPFVVKSVFADDRNILLEEGRLDTQFSPKLIELPYGGTPSNECDVKKGEVLVELKTPLRFKCGGKYTADFSAQDFMSCLYRRAKTLCQLYGEVESSEVHTDCSDSKSALPYSPGTSLTIIEKNLHWSDSQHYSAHQKNAMKLGGVTGTFKLSGNFSVMDIGLLEFARIANAGKNTNFGLGKLDFWQKWE